MKNKLKIEEPQIMEAAMPAPERNSQPQTVAQPQSKIGRTVSSFLSGKFLISETTLSNLPFLLYLAFLGLCYIGNGYYAQSKDRELDKLNAEIKDLNSRYVIAQSRLMYLSKESEMEKIAAPAGLKESLLPPDKIVVNDNSNTKPR